MTNLYRPAPPDGRAGILSSGRFRLVAFAAWSVLVWVVYGLAGVVVRLAEASVGWIAETVTSLAGLIGLGKFVAALNPAWWIESAVWLFDAIALPAAVVVWILGCAAILLAPRVLSRLGSMRRYRR